MADGFQVHLLLEDSLGDQMNNIIIGLITIVVGIFFTVQSKYLASITQRGNKTLLGLPFPLRSYEWGFKISGALFVVVGIAFVVGAAYLVQDMFRCENEIVKQVSSPTGNEVAVLYTRDCGATTSLSYILSILPEGKKFTSSENYRILTASNLENISIQWIGGDHLLVVLKGGEIFLQRDNFSGIKITYQTN